MTKKVLILVNHDVVIYNFRKELVERLLSEGHQVIISSPYGERIDDLVEMGCKYMEAKIERHGINPINELNLLSYYKKLMKDIIPDIVLTYTIKPNIYGGLAAKRYGILYIATITGLGTAVENKGILQKLTLALYRIALKNSECIFFQNNDNMRFMQVHGIGKRTGQLIPGSGVNLEEYRLQKYPSNSDPVRFLFIGRVMKAKGIDELLVSAQAIKRRYPEVEFHIVGACEERQYLEKLNTLMEKGIIHYYGGQENVSCFIERSHATILPSYHEGTSNVLLESAATGRPVIASSIPGCKETFDEGISGLGVEARNPQALTKIIEKFILLPYEKKKEMGIAGRRKMEKEYDRNVVVEAYMKKIRSIGGM